MTFSSDPLPSPDPRTIQRFNQESKEEVNAWLEKYPTIVIAAVSLHAARVAQREMERLLDKAVRGPKVFVCTRPTDLRGIIPISDIGVIIVSGAEYPWELTEELLIRGWREGDESLKVWYT